MGMEEMVAGFAGQYWAAITVFFATLLIIKIFKYFFLRKLRQIVKKTKTDFDDLIIEVIDGIGLPFYIMVALYLGSVFLSVPAFIQTGLNYLAIIIVTFYSIRGIQKIGSYWIKKVIRARAGKAITDFFELSLNIALWTIAVLLILSNMGYNITTLLAGMGIIGIAIAFALQKVLDDVFSAFSIYFDKPFEVGDFIIMGDDMGVVQDIGIKSTRIKTLQGQELVVSNHEITNTRINNYKRMQKRRIQFNFGVTYETPLAKLEKINAIVKKIFSKIKLAELDRVHFKNYGDFSLIYEVVYYLLDSDYNKYMDTQQEINLALKKEFEKEKIAFAYPTQMVYFSKLK